MGKTEAWGRERMEGKKSLSENCWAKGEGHNGSIPMGSLHISPIFMVHKALPIAALGRSWYSAEAARVFLKVKTGSSRDPLLSQGD